MGYKYSEISRKYLKLESYFQLQNDLQTYI